MTTTNIWAANKFIKEPAGNGGCPRIPTLKIKDDRGTKQSISSNEDKAKTFAKVFFSLAPVNQINEDLQTSQTQY